MSNDVANLFGSEKIIIVGGVPDPVGGVTTFIYRLAKRECSRIAGVFDMYYGKSKKDITPVDYIYAPRFSTLRLFIFLFLNKRDVYFNFSGVMGLVLLLLLPKREQGNWFLTLHNGGLEKHTQRSAILIFLAKLGARRVDRFGYLSTSQERAYASLGVESNRLVRIESFIPVNQSDVDEVDPFLFPEIQSFIKNETPYFVISGYPTKIYQHLEVLSMFERLWSEGVNVGLVAFLYGDDSDDIYSSIIERFSDNEGAVLYWGKDSESFLSVLKTAAGYLRMNTVDSFGVAVAEAVSLGVPCIATNVCERYDGARIVEVGDFEALSDFILQCNNANRVCQ
jgi:glycosyltransferase involved in cell wall biosynthesis